MQTISTIQRHLLPLFIKTDYDDGFPKLLIDHWGFSFQLKKHARQITDLLSLGGMIPPELVSGLSRHIPIRIG